MAVDGFRPWIFLADGSGDDVAIPVDKIDGIYVDRDGDTVIACGQNEFIVNYSVREVVERITGGRKL